MNIRQRIDLLREQMKKWGWDAAVISGSDPHNSEYTPKRWCQREFISGFTGSAGTVVVTHSHAGLWTDSRYFIQALRELDGSGIELHKIITPDSLEWADWLGNNLSKSAVVGIDGLCVNQKEVDYLSYIISEVGGSVVSIPDYLNFLWINRPTLPEGKVRIHEDCYSGRSVSQKLSWIRKKLSEQCCAYAIVSCLDQIAWLLNIRSSDIDYCPLVISYAIVEPDKVALFLEKTKVDLPTEVSLKQNGNISLYSYDSVTNYISEMTVAGKMLIDPSSLNFELNKAVSQKYGENQIVRGISPIELEKSIKNSVEIDGFKRAYIQDGVAQTRFFHWLEDSLDAGLKLTESDLSDQIHRFRSENPDFLDESFETISAYGENAALPHYSTVRGKDAVIESHGLYLIDSGAHYKYGTTDITRTIPVGPTTDEERADFTLVMKSMINLAMAIFPEGTPGCRLDAVARKPLWQTMRNFGHGTGHGVGNRLSVHEGPQSFRQNMKDQPIMPGMITSDEPGLYREGRHGIRHENMILCVPAGENEFGRWLRFETLTMTYIDTSSIIKELMSEEEIDWLNSFNERVYQTLKNLLSTSDLNWLRRKTLSI